MGPCGAENVHYHETVRRTRSEAREVWASFVELRLGFNKTTADPITHPHLFPVVVGTMPHHQPRNQVASMRPKLGVQAAGSSASLWEVAWSEGCP